METGNLMVVATERGEYGGIWRAKGDVFGIAAANERARWMRPADPDDSRWAVQPTQATAEAVGASDTARLSRIEGKLDWIIEKIQGRESDRGAPPDGPLQV